ncbi:MAG: radical SAM protein [Candidatus Omnitrophica bacterium]|nr:radical SAM protein [Candidatus Omnitrophota bacterium]
MKTESFPVFSQRIREKAELKRVPIRAMFELTYRCNFDCRHCYIPGSYRDSRADELGTKEVFGIIDRLRDIGTLYLGFTGGEPFLREDLFDILEYAGSSGFQTMVYTNGSLITAEAARKLKRCRVSKVSVSCHSISEATFEFITRRKGSFVKVRKAISDLLKAGIPVELKTNVMECNREQVSAVASFAEKENIQFRFSEDLFPMLDGSSKPYEMSLKAPAGPVDIQEEDICRGTTRRKHGRMERELFTCGVGKSNLVINPFGLLKPCLMLEKPAYDLRNVSLVRAWDGISAFFSGLNKSGLECASCGLARFCNWCPAVSFLESGSFNKCSRASRGYALIRERYHKTKGG